MGKKQKMKKAAVAAKAAAAAKAAVKQQATAADTKNNKQVDSGVENNEIGDKKSDLRSIRSNMQKLMNLARTPGRNPGSPRYMSSDSENTDSDDAATIVEQSKEQKAAETAVDVPKFLPIPKFSRGEKKARRILMKLDLEKVPNVSRVAMRKGKNVMLYIDQPEVYKCPNTNTLICFGEVRVEDTSNTATAQAAERYLNDGNVGSASKSKNADLKADSDDDDDVDIEDLADGQLDERDIELVRMQTECSRAKAIKALLRQNGDVVNAIMELAVG